MEDAFEFVNQWPEWRRENVAEFERVAVLGAKLWGDAENLKRQLELPSPQIPAGLGMKELLILEQSARTAVILSHGGLKLVSPRELYPGPQITVGAEQFSLCEARYEIVRRAIAALGGN